MIVLKRIMTTIIYVSLYIIQLIFFTNFHSNVENVKQPGNVIIICYILSVHRALCSERSELRCVLSKTKTNCLDIKKIKKKKLI